MRLAVLIAYLRASCAETSWRHALLSAPKRESFFHHRSLNRITRNNLAFRLCPWQILVVGLRKRYQNTPKKLPGDILETLAENSAGQGAKAFENPNRRGDRAVEGARLEIVCTPNTGTGGSNPPLSASRVRIRSRMEDRDRRFSIFDSRREVDVDC